MSLHAGVLVGCVVAHIVLSPLLIFGWGPVPALGPAGAGWGLVIPFAVGSLIMIRLSALLGLNRAAELPRNSPSMGIVRRYSQGRRSWLGEHGDYQSIHCHFDRNRRAVRPRGRHWLRHGSPARIHHAADRFWLRYRDRSDGGYELGCTAVSPRASDRLDGCHHDRSRVRNDWTDRRHTTEPLAGPIQQRPRSRAHWRAVSSDCWTGVPVLRARASACFS